MNVLLRGSLCLLTFLVLSVSSETDPTAEIDETSELPRYVVFPGLDADSEEVREWNMGFASPFNVFFGPKPYILGWMGEGVFGPGDEEEIEEGEGDYEVEGEEGEGLEGEEGIEGIEGEEEGVDPDYDYEQQ